MQTLPKIGCGFSLNEKWGALKEGQIDGRGSTWRQRVSYFPSLENSYGYPWLERYDWLWLTLACVFVCVLTVILPFALIFGQLTVVWVWWASLVVVFFLSRGVQWQNETIHNNLTTVLVVAIIYGFNFALRSAVVASHVHTEVRFVVQNTALGTDLAVHCFSSMDLLFCG